MRNRWVLTGLVAATLAGAWVGGWAQSSGDPVDGASASQRASGSGVRAESPVGKRPMTFADLQRMKRVSDPQISPSGKWVMFSVMEVDLEKNAKVNHLWVVPMGGGGEADSSAALRNDNQRNGTAGRGIGAGRRVGGERQVTFWKEGESGGRFSPDGRRVLFTATDSTTGRSQIFLAPWNESAGTLGPATRLTNVSTEADGAVWSPDSKRILFSSRVYPECSEGSSWVEEDNCDRRKDADAAASPVKAQVWDHLLYRHWDHYVGPKRSHVLVVPAADGNAVRDLTPRNDIGDAEAPTFSVGGPMGYAWAPGSEEIAYVTNLDLVPAASTNNDVFTLLLDDAGAKPRKISTSMGSDDGPAYSPDGKYIAFRSQLRPGYESDRFRLMLFERLTGTTTETLPQYKDQKNNVVRDLWVDEFVWASTSKSIAYVSADRGEARIEIVPIYPAPNDRQTAWQVRGGEFSEVQFANDGSLVASLMKVNRPTEIAFIKNTYTSEQGYDISLGETAVKSITHMNDALIDQLDLTKLEDYWFDGAGGTKVQGFIVRPPNFDETRKYPVKFLIHGGPQGAWGDAWSYRWNAELMAASGYVVVMVNPRGSTGYGQAFIDGVNGDWGGKAYVDLMNGLDYAEKHYPFIDKARECALGASYGGYMADWILTHTNRFACIVTHDGMFNPQSAYGDTEELWFSEWEFRRPAVAGHSDGQPGQPWRYAAGPIANDPFRKWSPMLSIQNAKTPTLVIHSQRDYRLDVSEGMQLFTALQRLNVPSRMLYFPDEGHWVLKPQNSKLWYETVGDWCDRWTKTNAYAAMGYETPAPAVAVAKAPPPDARTGQSRPTEMNETQPLPETAAPVVRETPDAPVVPVVRPQAGAMGKAMERSARTVGGEATFLIAISAHGDEVPAGSDAVVAITLRNLSDHQILFAHRPGTNNPEFSYTIEVRNAAGRAVEETSYGREARERQQTENRSVDYVQPGQSVVQTAHIAKLVNLSRPGVYRVRVSRRDPESKAVVESNEVTLNVVP